jgi:hypothetical protein
MSEIVLMKLNNEMLVPYDEVAAEFVRKMKTGELAHADYKRVRNYKFHKKYFALIKFAFDMWEPGDNLQYMGQPVLKNLKRFRKDIAILSGFFETTVNLKGEVRLEAKSISFAQMDEIEFEELYQATISIVLSRILKTYTRADLENVVDQLLLGFA